eukprot:COSAG06_NODE_24488_length_661_cov_0.946619_1_plen_59_part_01
MELRRDAGRTICASYGREATADRVRIVSVPCLLLSDTVGKRKEGSGPTHPGWAGKFFFI